MNEQTVGHPTRAEMQSRITDLEQAAVVDQELIVQLEAEGVLDRAKVANLELALVSARRIGAAVGILMATRNLTEEQAFNHLRAESQAQGRKLRDVAETLLYTGDTAVEP